MKTWIGVAEGDAVHRERRRIRRLIAPHLDRLIRHREPSWDAIQAIDAATKAPRKAKVKR